MPTDPNRPQTLATPVPARRGRGTTILTVLVVTFAVLLVTTVAALVPYTYTATTKQVHKLSNELLGRFSGMVIGKTDAFLAPADRLADLSARLAQRGAMDTGDEAELEQFALEIVRPFPQVEMFNWGDENGNFLMTKKMPDGSISTKIVRATADPPVVVWRHRDADGNVVETETSTEVDYDPRTRPWYTGAREAEGVYWTDVYAFFTDGQPGISAAHAIHDAEGRFVGAVCCDIGLAMLSGFLKHNGTVGESGVTFICNEAGEVVAHSELAELAVASDEGYRPILISEAGPSSAAEAYVTHMRDGGRWLSLDVEDESYVASFRSFPRAGKTWKVGVVGRDVEFIGQINVAHRNALLLAALVFLFLAAPLSVLLARALAKPIIALTDETERIRRLDLDGVVDVATPIREIELMREGLIAMKAGLGSFRRYVPSDLVRQLVEAGEEATLGGTTRELTILFTDIEGFTAISETEDASRVLSRLTLYFDELTDSLMESGGTIDKYIGDGILAFWGAPEAVDGHARRACRATLECRDKVHRLNAQWVAEGQSALHTRFGLHTGAALVGNMGSTERMSYSAVGESVNHASRLEGVNKIYGTEIIVSGAVRGAAGGGFIFRPLDTLAQRGVPEGMPIYELMADADARDAGELAAFAGRFGEALEAFRSRAWPEALAILEPLLTNRPDDAPCRLYVDRCRRFIEAPPSDEAWDQIVALDSKH